MLLVNTLQTCIAIIYNILFFNWKRAIEIVDLNLTNPLASMLLDSLLLQLLNLIAQPGRHFKLQIFCGLEHLLFH